MSICQNLFNLWCLGLWVHFTRGGRRWEPRSTSRPAFMVSKAADAAVWEDLKDIKPPSYDGNPLNLDRFLGKLDD